MSMGKIDMGKEIKKTVGLFLVCIGLVLCRIIYSQDTPHLSVWLTGSDEFVGLVGIGGIFIFIVGIFTVICPTPPKGWSSTLRKLGRRRRGITWPQLGKK